MTAHLTPDEAHVILDQLPIQPNVLLDPSDTPLFNSARAKLERSARRCPKGFFRHLVLQGVTDADAERRVRKVFGD